MAFWYLSHFRKSLLTRRLSFSLSLNLYLYFVRGSNDRESAGKAPVCKDSPKVSLLNNAISTVILSDG